MYHVSGEYAMFWHASEAGSIDLRRALMETLQGMRRAGKCSEKTGYLYTITTAMFLIYYQSVVLPCSLPAG